MDETDKNTLEVDILFGAIALGAASFWLRKRWKRAASLKWPMVAATIIGRAAYERNKGRNQIIVGVVSLDFDYSVNGMTYKGAFEEELPSVQAAQEQIENYLSMPFYVRYKPSKPAEYYVDPYRDVRLQG